MTIYDYLIRPFYDYDFLSRSLLLGVINAIGLAPVGVFLVNKRMSLVGDSFSHAILPGVAICYLLFGFNYQMMIVGGVVAAFILSLIFVFISKTENGEEDFHLAVIFVLSLALGVYLISVGKNKLDLYHILFGSILSSSPENIFYVALSSIFTLVQLILFRHVIIFESTDYEYLNNRGINTKLIRFIFFFTVYQNLVFTFVNLGTLLGFGFLILPQAIARLYTRSLIKQSLLSFFFSVIGLYMGILFSFHYSGPVGSSIVLSLGIVFIILLIIKKSFRKIGACRV